MGGMKPSAACGVLIQLMATAGLVSAQQASVHGEIQQVYNFQPRLLDQQQIAQKSGVLDQFWTKAKQQRQAYVPALRQELANFTNPPFFFYDGSMLLLSLSDTPADRKIVLAAVTHCDLRDLQANEYFLQVHRLAALNENTTAAAFHILENPGYSVFIAQHVLTLGQNYALVYLLLPTDQDFWLDPAIARLMMERDETAQKSLLLLLWYAQTNAADKAVKEFAADSTKPAQSRAYAQELIGRKAELGAAQRATAKITPEAALRFARRERLKAVSDEALLDLDSITMMLLSKRQ